MDTLAAPTNRLSEYNELGKSANQTLTELSRIHSSEEIQRFVETRLGALLRVCDAELRIAVGNDLSTQLQFKLGEPSHGARRSVLAAIETVLGDMLGQTRTEVISSPFPKKHSMRLVLREAETDIPTNSSFNGAFAADLAHKLRNYLAAIISAAEQLEETLSPAHDQDSSQLAGMISRSAQSQRSVIDRFLEAFGPTVLRNEKVNIHRCIQSALDHLSETRGYETNYQNENQEICGITDRTLLTRIVTELAANAAEANSKARATLRWHVSRNRLVIMLMNEGAVSADELIGDFLKPFYSKKAGHSGLGLNIVQRATESLGGTLRPITLHEHTLFAVSIPLQFEDLTDLHTERNP